MPRECLFAVHFDRCPNAFRDALLKGPELQECRMALQQAGCSAVLPGGGFAFVSPAACRCLQHLAELSSESPPIIAGTKITASHVICNTSFQPLIMEAVSKLRNKEGAKQKGDKRPLPICVTAEWDSTLPFRYPFEHIHSVRDLDDTPQGRQVQIRHRSFLSFGVQLPVDRATVASTSDARLGRHMNPRGKDIVLTSGALWA